MAAALRRTRRRTEERRRRGHQLQRGDGAQGFPAAADRRSAPATPIGLTSVRPILKLAQDYASRNKDSEVRELARELVRLDKLINEPSIDNFLEAVRLEAAHQCER